jgi:sRNA-binding regulator protein Hfq
MVYNPDFEVSSEGAIRHWEIPYARLENATPIESEAAAVLSLLVGTQLTGTVLSLDATRAIATIDFTNSMVYRHMVRNVRTYGANIEATWGILAIGDPVFYDRSATMPAGVHLSTSPFDNLGVAPADVNALFGHIVPGSIEDMVNWPTVPVVASTVECSIMQIGAGG